MTYNPRYYLRPGRGLRLHKAMDLVAYILTHQDLDRARIDRVAELIRKRSEVTIRSSTSRSSTTSSTSSRTSTTTRGRRTGASSR